MSCIKGLLRHQKVSTATDFKALIISAAGSDPAAYRKAFDDSIDAEFDANYARFCSAETSRQQNYWTNRKIALGDLGFEVTSILTGKPKPEIACNGWYYCAHRDGLLPASST